MCIAAQVGRARRGIKYCGEFASAAHQERLPGAQDNGDDGDDGGDGYSDDTPRCGSNHGDTCGFQLTETRLEALSSAHHLHRFISYSLFVNTGFIHRQRSMTIKASTSSSESFS